MFGVYFELQTSNFFFDSFLYSQLNHGIEFDMGR
jgi:hypothetical protein